VLLCGVAIWNQHDYLQFVRPDASPVEDEFAYPFDISNGFPAELPTDALFAQGNFIYPTTLLGCSGSMVGDPVFTGFNGEKFLVKGEAERIYNVLSLPSLQLNTRFIPLTAGQAMNVTMQRSVRQRQYKLLSALKGKRGARAANRLPSTTSWSHDGMYVGETGVQLSGHRLHVVPGAYETGFASVVLDGAELPVSSEAVVLLDGSSIVRSSSSVVEVNGVEAMFTLVNSDHFLNIESAVLLAKDLKHVDGLLGQTVDEAFHVERTKEFTQHVEKDFLLPEGADVWSTEFDHNQYVLPAGAF